ncbi:MAG: preprotein translocase subunit SecG [Deltaproteobacteria bacterium]|nr:preprotein translocase subunit SecG [Deltaproteobacteria bacterium]
MVTLVTIIHVIVGIFLILVVLLQGGKGAGLGAAFGGSSQTVFGASGASSFLAKLTAIAASLFVITSISLSYFSSKSESALAKYSAKKSSVGKKETTNPTPITDAGINVGSSQLDAGVPSEGLNENTNEEKK